MKMQRHRFLRALIHVTLFTTTAAVVLVGCGGSTGVQPPGGGGGAKSSGGETGNGGATATGGSAGAEGVGGHTGSGGTGVAGLSGGTGGGLGGITGSAGSGSGGANGGAAGATASSSEDDGADCAIATVPGLLTTSNAQLPDPFTKLDGTRMSTKAEWRCRREEILRMAEKLALGTKPPKPTVTGSVSRTSINVMASANGKSASFSATIAIPTGGKAPYPAIIVYGGAGFGAPLDSATINSEGVALITYNPYDVGAEGHGHGTNQTGAFYTLYSGGSGSTGLLAAWGWGVSRIIDVIAAADGTIIQADAIGVTGCSRFGKGAFIAGVLDQRVALTMPIESGTDGVPIWRGIAKQEKGANGNPPQSLPSAYGEQPWYADASNAWINDPTKTPVDTHELVAMVAPRGLFIMENPWIGELASKYGHVAALGGLEVYTALGAGDAVTYYSDVPSSEGTHCSNRPEWAAPLKNNIERFLKKTGTAPGVIKAAPNQTGDLSTWRSWTTPALN